MVLCSRCNKNDAVIMGLCSECFSQKHQSGNQGKTFEVFQKLYLQNPYYGLFWADDALLDFAYYCQDHDFAPQLEGEHGAEFTQEHNKLRAWYAENFAKLLQERLQNVAEHSQVNADELKELFLKFNENINRIVIGDTGIEYNGNAEIGLLAVILKRFIREEYGRKYLEDPDTFPNPEVVDKAAAIFDSGSGFYFLELFIQIHNLSVIYDIIKALNCSLKDLLRNAEYPLLTIDPWKHQQEAIDAWVAADHNGVAEMATATGKTLVGMLAIEELAKESFKTNTRKIVLITCYSRVILNQWRRELIRKMGIYGDINATYKDPLFAGGLTIRFETVQTLSKNHDLYTADLLIIDEVHHVAAPSFRKALQINSPWQLGLTAYVGNNPKRFIITQELGTIVYQYSLQQALKDNIIPSFKWVVNPVYLNIKEESEFEKLTKQIVYLFEEVRYSVSKIREIYLAYQRLKRDLASKQWKKGRPEKPPEDPPSFVLNNLGEFIKYLELARLTRISIPEDWKKLQVLIASRRQIINRSRPRLDRAIELARQLGNDHKIIIFLMDIESCEELARILRKDLKNIFVIHSKIEEDPISIVEAFKKADHGILIGANMLNEGIDIPSADIGINVAFAKSEIQLIQRMGRVLRKDKKKKPTFYQFVAIPVKKQYLEIMDAQEFIDDLAWVESTGLKMGLDIDLEWNSDELINYRTVAEDFYRESWNHDTTPSRVGTFRLDTALNEFSKTAIKRIPEILSLYKTEKITDAQWDDIIRTAHSVIDENGRFENGRKKRYINISRAWYILILYNRKVSELSALFKDIAKSIKPSQEHKLPKLSLDSHGFIDSASLDKTDAAEYYDESSFVVDFDSSDADEGELEWDDDDSGSLSWMNESAEEKSKGKKHMSNQAAMLRQVKSGSHSPKKTKIDVSKKTLKITDDTEKEFTKALFKYLGEGSYTADKNLGKQLIEEIAVIYGHPDAKKIVDSNYNHMRICFESAKRGGAIGKKATWLLRLHNQLRGFTKEELQEYDACVKAAPAVEKPTIDNAEVIPDKHADFLLEVACRIYGKDYKNGEWVTYDRYGIFTQCLNEARDRGSIIARDILARGDLSTVRSVLLIIHAAKNGHAWAMKEAKEIARNRDRYFSETLCKRYAECLDSLDDDSTIPCYNLSS